MRVKLFEAFNTDEYYQEITFYDYCDLTDNSSQDYDCLLTDEEKLWIEKNIQVEHWRYSNHKDIVQTTDVPRDIAIGVSSNDSGVFRFLYKIEDDYFVCGLYGDDHYIYYKCDQFDGLKKLLNDKGII